MSEAQASGQAPASTGEGASSASATPAAATPPVAAPSSVSVSMSSEQLAARLAEEREKGVKSWLKEHGFEHKKDAAALIQFAKEKKDSERTEIEKRDARIQELEPKAKRLETLEQRYAASVNAKFAALPDGVRAAIEKVAGEDVDERERMMSVFEAAGVLNAAPAQAAGAPARPALANTSAAAPAPASAPQKSVFDAWTELKQSSPAKASVFYSLNQSEIEKSRPAASG